MKHKFVFLAILVSFLAVPLSMKAYYNFSAVSPTGQTLYYEFINGNVKVTYPHYDRGDYYNGYTKPSGDLRIPSQVRYNGIDYTVVYIGAHAFSGCASLTSIEIPNSVTIIGKNAFSGCTGLTSVSIGDSVSSILDSAFLGCSSLTSVTIPNSVTSIGTWAFRDCTSLTSINIPNSVTSIETGTFSNCTSLTSITIPNSVTSIEDWTFYNCTSLTSINIPSSVIVINTFAFGGCSSLASVNIPSSVIGINTYAFEGCSGLTSVTIPNSVTIIGDGAFGGCPNLTNTYFTGTLAQWCEIDFRDCIANPNYYSHTLTINGIEITGNLDIPNTVSHISNSAFMGLSGITSVNIPSSVTSIGSHAFADCENLTSVTLPSTLSSIGSSAFRNCHQLDPTTIPNNVNTIGQDAFSHVKLIYYRGAASGNPWGALCVNGYQSDSLYYTNSSKTVLKGAHPAIRNAVIPNSVTTISKYSFENCYNLETLNLPNSVRTISDSAFENCYNLKSATLPTSLTTIGHGAFMRCSNLADTLTIPNSITSIGNGAFAGCTNISTVIFKATNCSSMGNGSVPVFSNCTSLSKIIIGNNVTKIPDYGFAGCGNVNTIRLLRSTPPTVYSNSFYLIPQYADVFVPCSTMMTYYNASNWNYFTNIIEVCETIRIVAIPNNSTMGSVNGGGNYYRDLEAVLQATPNRGYHFVHWSDGVTSNPRTIPVIRDTTFTAIFEADIFTLTANSNDTLMGRVIGGGDYPTNSAVRLQAIPNSGYRFVRWNDGVTTNPRTITVSSNISFTAIFEQDNFTITININDAQMGSVTGRGSYLRNSEVTLQAIPNNGYRFVRWSDSVTTNPRTITVSNDISLTAIFEQDNFTITVNINDAQMGSVTGRGSYLRNSEVTLQAIPNNGYRFVRWSDGVTTNPRTITVTDDISLTAIFELDNVVVTVDINDALMGSVTGGGNYLRNSEVTLQATPKIGYRFVRWNDGVTTNPRILIACNDTTLTAIFEETPDAIVTVNSNDAIMGNVTGGGSYPTNTEITLEAVPNRGYHFIRWSDNITDNPRTLTVNGDTTLTAYFEAITITVTVSSNDDMMGSVLGGGWYEAHTELTLQAIPNNGYRFVHWNDNVTDNPRTVTPFSDTTFTAYFALDENAGIDDVETLNAMIYTSNGQIVVDGTERNTVWLYDATGRLLSTKQNDYSLLRFSVPASGTYFVKIGKHPAQKVVVIK